MVDGSFGGERSDYGLGKSSLTVRFVDGVFIESYYPTIENTFSKTIKHRGQEFLTEIVDTAGQVRKSQGGGGVERGGGAGGVVCVVVLAHLSLYNPSQIGLLQQL